MLYRTLGCTSLRISEIGLGCASFWGKKVFDEKEAIRLVHAAIDHGVTFFDTGSSYSGGNAEPRLGKALSSLPTANDLVIATKAGTRFGSYGRLFKDFSPSSIRESVERSLVQLRLDTIPLLQLHGPQIHQLTDALLIELEKLRTEGKYRYLSVNSFDMKVIQHVMTLPAFEVVMIDYNFLRPEREVVINALAERKVGILAGMALAGGMYIRRNNLKFKLRDLWYMARAIKNHRKDLLRGRHFSFLNTESSPDWSASQLALAWVLRNPFISSAVMGTTRLENLLDNINTSGRTVPTNILERIDHINSSYLASLT